MVYRFLAFAFFFRWRKCVTVVGGKVKVSCCHDDDWATYLPDLYPCKGVWMGRCVALCRSPRLPFWLLFLLLSNGAKDSACSLPDLMMQASRRVYSRWHSHEKPPSEPSVFFCCSGCRISLISSFSLATNARVHFARDGALCFCQLVGEARKQERLLWYTSKHPDTPLHKALPLNTAVALPISLSVLRRDLCFVFFAEHDVNVSLRRHQN